MSKRILYLILFFYIALQYTCTAGSWKKLDSSIVDEYFQYARVACADSNNCVAVGNKSLFYPRNRVTKDGGRHWFTTLIDTIATKDPPFTPSRVYDLVYKDTNFCIAVCDTCYILRSFDGCLTWKKTKINCIRTPNQTEIFQIDFHNQFGVFITAFEMFITKDLGETWMNTVPQLEGDFKLSKLLLKDVSVPTDSCIIASTYNKTLNDFLIRSTDRGKTWQGFDGIPKDEYRIHAIFFFDENNGYIGGGVQYNPPAAIYKDIILHTTNGGQSWEVQLDTLLSPKWGIEQIHFYDKNNGIAIAPYWTVWKTSNGGSNWYRDTTVKKLNYNDFFSDAAFLTPTRIVGVAWDNDGIYIYDEDSVVAVEDIFIPPDEVWVNPNPAYSGSEVNIQLLLTDYSTISFSVYNAIGQELMKSDEEFLSAGKYSYNINDLSLSSGLYFIKINIGSRQITRKLLILK